MSRISLALLLGFTAIISTGIPEVIAQDDSIIPPLPVEAIQQQVAPPAVDVSATLADCGCEMCCCDCACPSWTGRVGYVHLWRENLGSDSPLLVGGGGGAVPAGTVLSSASQLDFEPSPGGDVSLIYDTGCGCGVEIRYLGLEEFSAEQTVTAATQYGIATNPASTIAFFNPTNVRWDSELHTFELVGRRCCDGMSLSYGFRYVDLDESLRFVDNNPSIATFTADNALYGFQLGVDAPLWDDGCGLRIDGLAKAGVYLNDVEATVFAFSGGATQRFGNASETSAAFVGELGLTAVYDLSCCLSLRAGYQLLYLDGVALAADQVSNTGNLGGVAGPPIPVTVDSSSLLYHGLNVGIERRW